MVDSSFRSSTFCFSTMSCSDLNRISKFNFLLTFEAAPVQNGAALRPHPAFAKTQVGLVEFEAVTRGLVLGCKLGQGTDFAALSRDSKSHPEFIRTAMRFFSRHFQSVVTASVLHVEARRPAQHQRDAAAGDWCVFVANS